MNTEKKKKANEVNIQDEETGSDSPLSWLPHPQAQKFNSFVSERLVAPRVSSLVWAQEVDLQSASESQ